jgi:hypothetical protein
VTATDPMPATLEPAARPRRMRRRVAAVDRVALGVLTAGFLVSRGAAHLAGVRFDASLLNVSLQHLDNRVLEEHLVQSLWYQHTQPPLFNLLIGLVLKFSPLSPERTFHLLWLALGVVLVAITYRLLIELRVPRLLALVATLVITCSPTVILYENWLSYEYPLTVAISALVLTSLRWVRCGELRWLAASALLAAGCVLTRALLNPLWFVAVVAVLLIARRPVGRWRPALIAVGIPALVITALMVKNQVLFGSPSYSSWLGWNLQRVTIDELPVETRQRLVDDGVLTPLATYPVFLPTETYADVVPPCVREHPDVPALAEPRKETGRENFNDECYLPIYRESLDNAIAAARAEPGATARAVLGSLQIWSESSSQYAFVYDNRLKIDGADTVYRQIVLLDVPYDPPVKTNAGWWIPIGTPGGRWRFSPTVIVATAIAAIAGARSLLRVLRRRATGTDAALAVIGLTVVSVTVVGNLFEIGENNRFRFMVEPITFVALTWFVARVWSRARHRWPGRATRRADRPSVGLPTDGTGALPGPPPEPAGVRG